MRYLLSILLFIPLIASAQLRDPLVYYKFDANINTDASGNGYHNEAYGNAGADPIYGVSGGYSMYLDGVNDRITIPTVDLGNNFAFSFWARNVADVDVDPQCLVFMGNGTSFLRIYLYLNTLRIGTTGSNNALQGTWTSQTFHHVVCEIDKTNSKGRIFVDGVRAAQTDSSISASFTSADSIYVGIAYSNTWDYYGNIDEFMILKDIPITPAVLDSLYTFKYLEPESGPVYPLQASTRHTGRVMPFYMGISKYMTYGNNNPTIPPSAEPIIYFADNFETWPDGQVHFDTVMYRWQPVIPNFYSPNQSIISVSGYGKVWRSQYLDQQEGPNFGYEIAPILSETLEEIYVDVDCYFSPTWYDPPTFGTSGKPPFGGAYGGSDWDGDNYANIDTVGDYNSTRGWGTHNGWGSGDPNDVRGYLYDQTRVTESGGYNYVYSVDPFVYTRTRVTRGEWHRYTTRIKLNTPGKFDGILAKYKDGVMFLQDTTVMYRSLDQHLHGLNKIEGLIIKYAFGGGPSYISEQTNVIYMDNIVAYAYPPTSPYYLPGPDHVDFTPRNTIGGTITETIYPETIFSNETFTATADTIKSHYTGGTFVPASQVTYTKTITGHTNPIHLTFLRWHDGVNGVEGVTTSTTKSDCWVKIWAGTNTSGAPLYWFQEPGEHSNVPTVGSVITINSTACTIQYFPGKDMSKGWTIRYY